MTRLSLMLSAARRSQKNRAPFIGAISLLCVCMPLTAASQVAASQSEDPRELSSNAPIDREIKGGEIHVYKITLAAETYLRLSITPRDIAIESKLLPPSGSENIGAHFSPTGHGLRFVSLVAESPGSYRLEIRLAKDAKAGRYEVKIEILRSATEQDKVHVAAEKVESEGRSLTEPASRRGKIAKIEEALGLWRKLGERKDELRTLQSLAVSYHSLGEPQAALEYYKQAIEIARAVGDNYQEGNLLIGFGLIYDSLGEYQKALDAENQARQIFKSQSKRYGEAIALHNLALTLLNLGERQNVLPYLEEVLPTLASVGDHFSEVSTLNMMGLIHRSLGDNSKALELNNRALEIARASKIAVAEVLSLGHLGNVYFELGDLQKALDLYEQSLKICRTSRECTYEGDSLKRIGDVYYLMRDYQKALEFFNQSLDRFRSIGARDFEAITLHCLAQVNYALGNFDEARKQIEQSLAIRESLRTKVISQDLREIIFTSAQSSFALYIDLLMQLHKKNPAAGHDKAALQASEREHARSLLELLSESQADIRQGVSPNLLELERSLQQQINAKAAARTRLLSDKRTEAQAPFFDKEIAELTARFREVEVQIRQSSPRYAALTQPQPATATEIQQLLDDDTVLLEFALGEKQSWLWAVTRASINSYQLPSSSEIDSSARKVYELLTARQPRRGEADAQYQARTNGADAKLQTESAGLSQMLLGQIADKLQQEWKGKRLAIVAPGSLEYLPFAALPAPAPQSAIRNPRFDQPLITQHEIVNLPSASALAAIRSETLGRKPAENTVAVLADPVFELSDQRVVNARMKRSSNSEVPTVRSGEPAEAPRGETTGISIQNSGLKRSLTNFNLTDSRGGFSRLPFSREEAEAISSLAPRNSFMRATDFQANRANAMNGSLSHYRIVHFATHGLLNSEHPELSSLVLSLVDEKGEPQDGFLRMDEIYNLQLPADLIVLSACQTALGKQIKGEGLIGLTRGFMYAGARSVVASLWQVDDLATAHLMKTFYRGMLKDGLRPAEALRLAQLEMLKQQRWSSPYFWAPFVIQGEWR